MFVIKLTYNHAIHPSPLITAVKHELCSRATPCFRSWRTIINTLSFKESVSINEIYFWKYYLREGSINSIKNKAHNFGGYFFLVK